MAKSLILWLHGRGDTGPNNMFIKNFFSASEFANTKWLFPTAPSQRITCNNGQVMPAWFDTYEIPVTAESPKDEEGIMKSVKKIHEMIDKEAATGALTLASTMLYPKTLGGAAVFSGSVQFNNKLSFIEKISPEAKQTPILWCHGMSDNIVDFGAGQVAPPLLEQAGVSCQFKAYPGLDHVISTEELTFLEGWIKGRIQSSSL
uniref:TSA: Wollemia nobilis Ref_Wollemi_Transcript_13587_951 transcribed RNA sequence n=1 Tax=Wollemia nobilis TaxID=56998 RepID=A0A0C9S4X5_9CONI